MKHEPNFTMKTGGEDDPASIVTKALDEFRGAVDERLKAVESVDMKALTGRLDKIEARQQRPGAVAPSADEAAAIERKAFGQYLRYGNAAPADEIKALSVSSDPQGGYLAPAEMSAEMLRNIVEISPIRRVASVRSTSAPSVVYPARTSVTNALWRGESQASTGSEPGFGQHEVVVKEVTTHVDISNQLLADSAGQAEAEVRLALAEDFAQKEAIAFIRGAGPLQPEGMLTAAGVPSIEVPLAQWTAPAGILATRLVDAFYDLSPAYRRNATWIVSSTALAAIRKQADTTARWIWNPALAEGQPETILGRPVLEVDDLDPTGVVGNVPIVFGDFAAGYRLVDRLSMSVLVNPYLLATNGLTRIHATRRVGGGVIRPDALRKITITA